MVGGQEKKKNLEVFVLRGLVFCINLMAPVGCATGDITSFVTHSVVVYRV